ncbi:MAG: XdhC family protein [Bacteroidota bacterium]
MREIDAIIESYERTTAQGIESVLATVVHVEGSSYRRPSARMLVDEHGMVTGAISGGCLEGDALRKALYAFVQKKNTLVTYDTSDEDDAIVGAQLGCNGVIQVLFEPIDSQDPQNPIQLIKRAIASKKPCVLVTLFNLAQKNGLQPGTSLLVEEGQQLNGTLNDPSLTKSIQKDAQEVINRKSSLFREYIQGEEHTNVFIEYFAPPVSLVIIGAGNDTQVLAKMAELLGWIIYVVDGRQELATTDRFASSCQVIVSKPEDALENISIDERTVFVLMTHNYNYDLGVLRTLIPMTQIPYIGILGPKKKFNRMLDDLKKEQVEIINARLKDIYAPIGLEIGAETPEEIALSVLAEIKAVLEGTQGGLLRDKEGPIHSKDNTQFDSVKI